MIALLSLAPAWATSDFDPTAPEAVFTGDEVKTHDGNDALWSRIDRYGDPDRELFHAEEFNAIFEWRDSEFTPHMQTLFGTSTPHSSQFLLHYGLHEETSSGTPILLVHGAGDNASRPWFGMRRELEDLGRPVYAITFAHPHGEMLMQAEAVANAIAVIKARTGASEVDLVAHSKGGLAVVAYTSNTAGTSWGDAGYEAVGTPYRGDVRRMVLAGVPLDGIDTAYRWPASNFFGLDTDAAVAPVSWTAYYPFGAGTWWVEQDLEGQDFLPENGDPFPGQRQLLKRQPHTLPGAQPFLGGYALQTDWWTTYEGGFGFYSHSYGIDAAIEAGGDFVDVLASKGVDPEVEIFILAGKNPLMPNGEESYKEVWDGIASKSQWGLLIDSINTWVTEITTDDAELQGLADGQLVLGEVSGPSDGVLFLSSATATQNVDARGAQVVETRVVDISHTELLLASDEMGWFMYGLAGDDPANAWMIARGNRYLAANTTAWVAEKLADSTGAQGARGDANEDADAVGLGGIGGCDTVSSGTFGSSLLVGLLALLGRRR
ncbi:MAG: hypothetical protein R3F61_14215 [Myxococcota bacterium]